MRCHKENICEMYTFSILKVTTKICFTFVYTLLSSSSHFSVEVQGNVSRHKSGEYNEKIMIFKKYQKNNLCKFYFQFKKLLFIHYCCDTYYSFKHLYYYHGVCHFREMNYL